MAQNKGKQFEAKFKADFLKTLEDSTLDRLYDTTNGFKTIANISDFIGYKYPNIFYLECKSHLKNTFPLANLTQYEALKTKVGIPGVRAGVVLWFIDHDKIWYVPISTITKMIEDGKKSIHALKDIEAGYRILEIPSVKKRVFLDSDYSVLMTLSDGE